MDYSELKRSAIHWFDVRNPALFLTYKGQEILFYLAFENSEMRELLHSLIASYGGYCVKNEDSLTERTVIIVREESNRIARRPAFKMSYITDCISKNELLDISQYICDHSGPYNINFMDIIFYCKASFSSECSDYSSLSSIDFDGSDISLVVSTISEENKIIENNNNRAIVRRERSPKKKLNLSYFNDFGASSRSRKALVKHPSNQEENNTKKAELRNETDDDSNCSISVSAISSQVCQKDIRLVNKHTKRPYTLDEKEAILKFLIKHRNYTGLRGDSVWKTMEARQVCPHRTFQSMKEHFAKVIAYELDRYAFLSNQQKEAFMKARR